MKTLLTGIFMATAMLTVNPPESGETQAKMEMLLFEDEVFQEKVKIFDYSGNPVQELKAKDVAENEISIAEFLVLESSDYAFEYLGDYYYFRD